MPFGEAGARAVPAVVAAVVVRPWLWPTAVALAWRMAPPGWWRRWPPRPWPDKAYLRFRMQTAYGDGDAGVLASPGELIDYLEWCRRMAALRRS